MGLVERFDFTGVPPGTYTLSLLAQNAGGTSGPSNAVTLTLPGACPGPPLRPAYVLAYRSGNTVSTTVDLTNGAIATYTITGTVSPGTTGTLANTASVTTPLGTLDPQPGNNVATDSNNAQAVQADPTITITPGTSNVARSAPLDFTVTVSNSAATAATGVKAV